MITSSDSGESDIQRTVINQKNTTIRAIESNPRFYLGLRKEVYTLLQFVTSKKPVHHVDVLKKIRLGDVYTRLAVDLEMSTSNIQRIFLRSVQVVTDILQSFLFWLPTLIIKQLLPIPFRMRYSNVVTIIDCFEVKIEQPSNALAQSQTWSEYKNAIP